MLQALYLLQLERYLRKLDMELQKFKLELEADNAGITEMLEKREPLSFWLVYKHK